jgi:hypothetical protein
LNEIDTKKATKVRTSGITIKGFFIILFSIYY